MRAMAQAETVHLIGDTLPPVCEVFGQPIVACLSDVLLRRYHVNQFIQQIQDEKIKRRRPCILKSDDARCRQHDGQCIEEMGRIKKVTRSLRMETSANHFSRVRVP